MRVLLTLVLFVSTYSLSAQWRNVYSSVDSFSSAKDASFLTQSEGFIVSNKWVGYTMDTGHTIQKKFVSSSNIDYSGFNVSLPFGFYVEAVKAFSKDTLVIGGHFGFEPAILRSVDQGTS